MQEERTVGGATMKKRWYWLLLAALVLCGCTYEGAQKDSGPDHEEDSRIAREAADEHEEGESEPVMKEQTISIEEIRQAAAGTIITADQLNTVTAEQLFYQEEITDPLFERIYGKSYKENCTIPRTELVYLRVLHRGLDQETHIGEMLVHQEVAEDLLEIFQELYQADYPIEKMKLIDDYKGNDEASMADNNSSAFNYRTISYSDQLSNHSYGKAVDINPLYNPYIKTVNGELSCEPASGSAYIDREQDFLCKIDENDLCYQLFTERGFSWGGEWQHAKDYQHFEK